MHLGALSKSQRIILGLLLLLFVNFISVASGELAKYIASNGYDIYSKPFFTTYIKSMLFMIYLLGFIIWKPWRRQCRKSKMDAKLVENNGSSTDNDDVLTDPIFVPLKSASKQSSDSEEGVKHTVRFSNLSEIRELPAKYATDAAIARLSYTASLRAEELHSRALSKLSVKQVAKISLVFSIPWFFSMLSNREAMKASPEGLVNILSSTSAIFTLVLASLYPSSSADRFSLTKVVVVLVSLGGVVLVCLSASDTLTEFPVAALWALLGAALYTLYLVVLRRRVDSEEKMDIPMFLGFVGLSSTFLVWPGFVILHYTRAEVFEWPTLHQWLFITMDGVFGTVIYECLWLWGCFMTSSLIATLSLSLAIPLTMFFNKFILNITYSWMLYLGTIPVLLSFMAVSFLTLYDKWDPVLLGLKKLCQCLPRKTLLKRSRELDREQTTRLMEISTSDDHTT